MRILMGILTGVLLCSLSFAQDSAQPQTEGATPRSGQTSEQPAQSQQPSGLRIAAGSVIPVQLTKTVDAKKAKIGDEVDAKVTEDLKTKSGEVVVPKDTKVIGHVTDAQARTKEQKESEIGIAFDHAVLKDGDVASLPMSIQAVVAQQNQNLTNDQSAGAPMSPSSGMPSGNGGERGGMGGGAAQQQAPNYPTGGVSSNPAPTQNNASRSITANTQGVVGISNYKLSTPGDVKQGSVVSSEKDNVKLESGTLMLLKVNQ
jgi:hypothetical protein